MTARYAITATELHADDLSDEFRETNRATYCPEDNKIRLYLSARVERQSYDYLRKCGYVATPKQNCSFVATWCEIAEDAALDLIADDDDIADEDIGPEERAADRAERFAAYRDKRRGEAHGHADRFDAGPAAHGFQSQARAERSAARHGRYRDRALCQWEKAEYWQTRTAGVISNALHRSSAHVRRGRILEIEARMRQIEAYYTPAEPVQRVTQTGWNDNTPRPHVWCAPRGGRGGRWVDVESLDSIRDSYTRELAHLSRRLIYENAMLANEGGQASELEMVVGGWIGDRQILKINKSPVTGRVVSVQVQGTSTGFSRESGYKKQETKICRTTLKIDRMGTDVYRPPTAEDLETLQETKKAVPAQFPLINPTEEDAERMQAIWSTNYWRARCKSGSGPAEVRRLTDEEFKAINHRTFVLNYGGVRLRVVPVTYDAYSVIVLTDKPRKPLPVDWESLEAKARGEQPAPAPVHVPVTAAPVEALPEMPTIEARPVMAPALAGMLF